MFRLAGILHARGFAVTVFHTHFNAPDPSRHPEYRFVAVPDGMSGPAPVAIEDVVAHILALNAACEAPFRDRLAAVLEEYSRTPWRASSSTLTCCPWWRWPFSSPCAPRPPHWQRRLPLVLRRLPSPHQRGYLLVGAGNGGERAADVRVRDLMQLGRHHDLTQAAGARRGAVKASSGIILNTFDALERPELAKLRRDLDMPVFDIGLLHLFSPAAAAESSLLRQDRSCLKWLDAQPAASVLYVSFGSLACMSARDLVETAWGIAGSRVPFLWVVRPGLVAADGLTRLPDGFEAATSGRGMVVEWAPQEEVLRHPAVAGFWTHGGWNSTTESVCEGVPMLCRPHFGDQMGNARYVEHVWKVGFEVAGALERLDVEKAIRRLVTGSEGAEMRARAGELKKAAKECTGEAGSSGLAIGKLVDHMLAL
ncbi:hypothetical protein ZWY2020_018831 [Hordeum vulgare]|nr:hypothetical protein ZWY2020_018831 [Hordeum vulgare]